MNNYFTLTVEEQQQVLQAAEGRIGLPAQAIEKDLQINRPTIFLKDNLYIDADWNSARSNVSGTMSLSQKTETPSFSATNDLQLVKRIDDNLLTVSSRNRYSYKPHSLFVSGIENDVQDITSGDFRSVTEARYGWILGRLRVYARGGVDFNYHDLMSSLTRLGCHM